MEKIREALPPGTVIDCYTIIKLIGSGGFSLIYLAEDEDTQDHVVIKEYMPKKLAVRNGHDLKVCVADEEQRNAMNNGRKLFYQEAKTLASLKHPNIVNVRTFFLSYNTAYMVMDYEHGKNLGHYINGARWTEHNFSQNCIPSNPGCPELITQQRAATPGY